METRTLGQGLEVSAMGLGCMGLSDFYGGRYDTLALATTPQAPHLRAGSLVTPQLFGVATHATLVCRAFRGDHTQFVMAPKFASRAYPKRCA